MFCPQCSQQRTSENIRFCSRCGFQLDAVAELIFNDGILHNSSKEPQGKLSLFRESTYRVGAKLIFLSLVLLPVIFILSYVFDSPVPFIFPLLIFFSGIAQLTYVRLFTEEVLPGIRENESGMGFNKPAFSLHSSTATPISNIDFRRRDTGEMIQPPSVTEHTTKLLEPNAESSEPEV